MTRKYGSQEKGKKVCGALQKRLESRNGSINEPISSELGARELASASEQEIFDLVDKKKIITYKDGDRRFIKVFLFDGSTNYNGWGVDESSIPLRVASVIGKPIVAYVNQGWEKAIEPWRREGEFDHPLVNDKDYHHALAYQDLYRVATYIDYVQAPDKSWWGIAEVTDDGVKKALDEDPDLPIFTSSSVRLLYPVTDREANKHLKDWEFMHSAIVDRPAYGVKKAYISGECSGDKDTCVLHLRKASIEDHGYGCGFCTYGALMKLGSDVSDGTDTSHVSSEDKSAAETTIMSSTDQQNKDEMRNAEERGSEDAGREEESKGSKGAKGEGAQEKKMTFAERQRAEAEKARETDLKKRADIRKQELEREKKPEGTSDDDFERFKEKREQERKQIDRDEGRDTTQLLEEVKKLSTENASLREELKHALGDNEALNSFSANLNDRLKALEEERRKEQEARRFNEISDIVNSSMAYRDSSKEVRDKQVNLFYNSSLSTEQVREFISPVEANIRKASYEGRAGGGIPYRSRLQVGKSGTVVDSRTASIASQDDPDEKGKPRYLQFSERLLHSGVEY